MTRRPRLTPPSPTGSSWQAWGNRLIEYLMRQTDGEVVPAPALLEHQVTRDAKAAVDGVMMYDPVQGQPVFSKEGVWQALTGGGGDCCGNIDGGQADTNYGGIFCPIDGGDANGTTDPAP